MDTRKQKGMQIAQTSKIDRKEGAWIVPSQTGSGSYKVEQKREGLTCSCPDYELRGNSEHPCKHVYAVLTVVLKWMDEKTGRIVEVKRVYTQNWSVYNKSQIEEKEKFMALLKGLIENVPENIKTGRGRPNMPVRDLLFSSALKVYSQFSLRRFMTDLNSAKDTGYVDNAPCYSSVGKFMERQDITPILYDMVEKSALPLKDIESKFAIDSSGFRTTQFNDYCREKHKTGREHKWMKAHICTGVYTNIITSVKITDENGADCLQFVPLSETTKKNGFGIQEMSADKAYSARENFEAIADMGGTALIPFKTNATGKAKGSVQWKRMYHYFMYNREDFMARYHLRSNVETTFFMIKAKFNDMLKSKTQVAQVNELLLKILCHNLVVVNSAINEFGIMPNCINA